MPAGIVPLPLTIHNLRQAYQVGDLQPTALIHDIYASLEEDPAAFIHLVPKTELLQRCKELEDGVVASRPALWGIPFAVKDNIDVAGCPTTAGCPAFSYVPQSSAPAVQALLAAGCIMVGKTNMDQFAAGLVGTRSPYGVPKNAFDDRFCPGGSSSGSGALVGSGKIPFALGTDTAGSGRVPAMFNGCVGLKPTVGRVSTSGVVPACRSLDCVTVFAATVEDAATVTKIMQEGGSIGDDGYRFPRELKCRPEVRLRVGIPDAKYLNFDGPGGKHVAKQSAQLFEEATQRVKQLGAHVVNIDFHPFAKTAELLYGAAFVAERYSGIRHFLEAEKRKCAAEQIDVRKDDRMMRVTAEIISRTGLYTAPDVFDGMAQLEKLRAAGRVEWQSMDVLMVPTALHHYTLQEIKEEEEAEVVTWSRNGNLGKFTNFVNLMDLCAIAVPSGIIKVEATPLDEGDATTKRAHYLSSTTHHPDTNLPLGVTFIAQAWCDDWLWELAEEYVALTGIKCGPAGHGVQPIRAA